MKDFHDSGQQLTIAGPVSGARHVALPPLLLPFVLRIRQAVAVGEAGHHHGLQPRPRPVRGASARRPGRPFGSAQNQLHRRPNLKRPPPLFFVRPLVFLFAPIVLDFFIHSGDKAPWPP